MFFYHTLINIKINYQKVKENLYLRIKKYASMYSLGQGGHKEEIFFLLKSNKKRKHKTKYQQPSKACPQRKFMAFNVLNSVEERLKSNGTKDL